jgi:hypothetical protein
MAGQSIAQDWICAPVTSAAGGGTRKLSIFLCQLGDRVDRPAPARLPRLRSLISRSPPCSPPMQGSIEIRRTEYSLGCECFSPWVEKGHEQCARSLLQSVVQYCGVPIGTVDVGSSGGFVWFVGGEGQRSSPRSRMDNGRRNVGSLSGLLGIVSPFGGCTSRTAWTRIHEAPSITYGVMASPARDTA